jgi:WD40 repeat protein
MQCDVRSDVAKVTHHYHNVTRLCAPIRQVKLWDQRSPACLHTLHSVDLFAAVNDACWSPTRSTVLASVAGKHSIKLLVFLPLLVHSSKSICIIALPLPLPLNLVAVLHMHFCWS